MTDDSVRTRHRTPIPQWMRATTGLAVPTVLLSLALSSLWPGELPITFPAAVALVLAAESAIVFHALERDRHGANPRPFTSATWVTVTRGAAVAVLAGFAVAPPASPPSTAIALAWTPAALFAAAALLDAVDGLVARLTDSVTALGARLDVEMDGLVVLVGTVVAAVDGGLPSSFLAVAGARYLFVAGRWWRERRGRPVFELPPNRARRPLGALAMLAVWVALVPVVDESVSRAFATLVLIPFLANFCWDWLAVTGRLDRVQ